MKVKILEAFSLKLNKQIEYIAKDKPVAARKLKSEFLQRIRSIASAPYQNRKSIYFRDDNIRDLIFKGYKIVYRISPEEKTIEVFGFSKNQEKL